MTRAFRGITQNSLARISLSPLRQLRRQIEEKFNFAQEIEKILKTLNEKLYIISQTDDRTKMTYLLTHDCCL